MDYYVISNSDGDVRMRRMSREQLLTALNRGDYGSTPEWLSEAPADLTGELGGAYLIIRGEIVQPEAQTTVVRHSLP